MSIRNNRVFYSDNGTLTDISKEVNDMHANPYTFAGFVAAEDYIYIGSDIPFNHRYLDMGATVNATASTMSVSLWDGSAWTAAADVIDYTSASGASLGQKGIVSFELDKDESWALEHTDDIAALSTLNIGGLYWARIAFSANLDAGTILNYVGFRFSDNNLFEDLYPDLSKTAQKTAFESGKTDWDEQLVLASNALIRKLKENVSIYSPNQIIRWDDFDMPCAHYTAYLIYNAFGDDYANDRDQAYLDFERTINFDVYKFDRNKNTRLDKGESFSSKRIIRR